MITKLINTESFQPTFSHFSNEHFSNTRYLPSDINIVIVHQEFFKKYQNQNISYEFCRCKLKKNIFLTNLGYEGYEECEQFKLHDHNTDSIKNIVKYV